MSVNVPYYECGIHEHVIFPMRKAMALGDNVVIRTVIEYPNEINALQCDDYFTLKQLLRRCLLTDADGNVALRLFST